MTDYGLDLAVIGNGRTAALVDPGSRIVWWCFPRYDSDPVFCRLLAGEEEKGFTDVVLDGQVETKSDYVRNTAIVTTTLDREGGGPHHGFAPQFEQFGCTYRRPSWCDHRWLRLPGITIRFRPTHAYAIRHATRDGPSHALYRRRRRRG